MFDSEEYRDFRNGTRYYTSIKRTGIDHGSIEGNETGNHRKISRKSFQRPKY